MLERPQSKDEQDRAATAANATSHTNVPQDDIKIKARSDVQDVLKVARDVARETTGAEIDTNAPLMSAGLDSISATEFIEALAAYFSVDLAPTILFDHPTLDSLADFISSELASNAATETTFHEEEQLVAAEVPVLDTREERTITIGAWDFTLAGGITTPSELRSLSMRALEVNTDVPIARWATPTPGAGPSAAYGSFMTSDQLSLDYRAFGISLAEARSMDPQ